MKKYNWSRLCDSFVDAKESGNIFFDVVVGSGRPQRLYPETRDELAECRRNVTASNMNPTLGALYPEKVR